MTSAAERLAPRRSLVRRTRPSPRDELIAAGLLILAAATELGNAVQNLMDGGEVQAAALLLEMDGGASIHTLDRLRGGESYNGSRNNKSL